MAVLYRIRVLGTLKSLPNPPANIAHDECLFVKILNYAKCLL